MELSCGVVVTVLLLPLLEYHPLDTLPVVATVTTQSYVLELQVITLENVDLLTLIPDGLLQHQYLIEVDAELLELATRVELVVTLHEVKQLLVTLAGLQNDFEQADDDMEVVVLLLLLLDLGDQGLLLEGELGLEGLVIQDALVAGVEGVQQAARTGGGLDAGQVEVGLAEGALVVGGVVVDVVQLLTVHPLVLQDVELAVLAELVVGMDDAALETLLVVLAYLDAHVFEHVGIRLVGLQDLLGVARLAGETLRTLPPRVELQSLDVLVVARDVEVLETGRTTEVVVLLIDWLVTHVAVDTLGTEEGGVGGGEGGVVVVVVETEQVVVVATAGALPHQSPVTVRRTQHAQWPTLPPFHVASHSRTLQQE